MPGIRTPTDIYDLRLILTSVWLPSWLVVLVQDVGFSTSCVYPVWSSCLKWQGQLERQRTVKVIFLSHLTQNQEYECYDCVLREEGWTRAVVEHTRH